MDNNVILKGKVIENPKYNHTVIFERFFMLKMSIQRISGTKDIVPVMVSEEQIDVSHDYTDETVIVSGRFCSYNKKEENGVHLILYVLANSISVLQEETEENKITLDGFICKEPTIRKTPRGRDISDIIVVVPRSYGKADYIPCVCWGNDAIFAYGLNIGDRVEINGRIQSRQYRKIIDGLEHQKTAYEVSVSDIAI